jgi:hypothetical protein
METHLEWLLSSENECFRSMTSEYFIDYFLRPIFGQLVGVRDQCRWSNERLFLNVLAARFNAFVENAQKICYPKTLFTFTAN